MSPKLRKRGRRYEKKVGVGEYRTMPINGTSNHIPCGEVRVLIERKQWKRMGGEAVDLFEVFSLPYRVGKCNLLDNMSIVFDENGFEIPFVRFLELLFGSWFSMRTWISLPAKYSL